MSDFPILTTIDPSGQDAEWDCTRCGGLVTIGFHRGNALAPDGYFAACQGCGRIGKCSDSALEAAEFWHRAYPPKAAP